MGVLTSEVGYTSATARRGDHEISYKHVVALGKKCKCDPIGYTETSLASYQSTLCNIPEE